MPYRPHKVHVVSHTHWDREWYETFHTFRVHLARVVKRVLAALEDDPEFRHFLLDGQTILLEDYVAAHPEDEGRIRALVASGALAVGPWYVLPDEFLIGAESHVRNLLIGHAVGRRFGGVQKVGYMPDSFGHVAQVPQLLRLAGMDAFVYTRGNGDEIEETGHEFLWEAPDGSSVLAINQCGGYCNGAGLGFDEIWHAHTRRNVSVERAVEQVTELFDKMEHLSRGDVVLLNNGCDHFPPQQAFGAVMAALRKAFPGTEFVHSELASFLDDVRSAGFAKNRFRGELVAGKLHHILSGVWSARMPLKQRNERCQGLLANQLEPLCAYTHFVHGRPYPSGLAGYAWKLLLENAPHDSICGCSTDAVHRDMEPRFDGVEQTAVKLLADELETLAPTFARDAGNDRHTVLCVANSLPIARNEVVDRWVVLQPFGIDPDRLALVDEDGRDVPFDMVYDCTLERFWGVDYRTLLEYEEQDRLLADCMESFGARILKPAEERDVHDTFLHLQFRADLPALGHRNLRLIERGTANAVRPSPAVRVHDRTIENEHCRVTLYDDGTLDLEHRAGGRVWRGLNVLEDSEDVGDEYDYSPAEDGETITSADAEDAGVVEVVEEARFAATLRATFTLPLPEAILGHRQARSPERVACGVQVDVRLVSGSPLVRIETTFENLVEDHRLRAHFPSLAQTDRVLSDGHFFTNERPLEPTTGEDWRQPHPGTYPQQDFSLLEDGRVGVAILNRGLPEFEPLRDGSGAAGLALTLVRSVGWLSRDDFPTRRHQNAGPTIATPEAQCPGLHVFRYALAPFEGDWVTAGIKALSQAYRTPPLVVQGVEDLECRGAGSFLETVSGRTHVTAVKKHEERDTLVVRFYALTGEGVLETLRFGRDVASAWRTDLLEERLGDLTVTGGRAVEVPVRGHEIVTVEIAFAS